MKSGQETFLSDEYSAEASTKLLRASVYIVFILHFGISINAYLSGHLDGYWLFVSILLGTLITVIVISKQLQERYSLCSVILLLILFCLLLSPINTAYGSKGPVLIGPLIPLMALFLLGKKYAWGILLIEAVVLLSWEFLVTPAYGTGVAGKNMPSPYLFSLIVSSCVLIISQIYVNLNNQLSAQLHTFASQDYLTGVLNRHALDVQLEKSGKKAESSKQSLAVILADIDFFKDLNDEHGHLVGDWCLEQIGMSFKVEIERLYKKAKVGRYGGEEFVIILPGCKTVEDAKPIAEAMRLAAGAAGSSAVPGEKITLTMGMAFTHTVSADIDADRLLESADIALYQGKNSGRDKLVCLKV